MLLFMTISLDFNNIINVFLISLLKNLNSIVVFNHVITANII